MSQISTSHFTYCFSSIHLQEIAKTLGWVGVCQIQFFWNEEWGEGQGGIHFQRGWLKKFWVQKNSGSKTKFWV